MLVMTGANDRPIRPCGLTFVIYIFIQWSTVYE